MTRSHGRYTETAKDYIDGLGAALQGEAPGRIAQRIRRLVADHDDWRGRSLNLNAADNILSVQARALLASDLATRVTEGIPGDKDFPAHRQNRFIDEIEATIIGLGRRLFDARHVEWRPISTSMANATVMFALTNPGDSVMTQPEAAGGNYSYNSNGPPRAAHLRVLPLPFDEATFEVATERAVAAILRERPKLVILGGSNVLFPYPLGALRAAADRVGAVLIYDAAHVALLVATGGFQDPLREGAHIMTLSTHKIMSGAVGGMILTNDETLAKPIMDFSFPTLIQTRDQNKYAATAHALAEMAEYGIAYANQTVANARALGAALEDDGFQVLASDRGYTQTHQIFTFVDNDRAELEDRCQCANLLVTAAQRMGTRIAIRLTTQELTRRGLTEQHMPLLSGWLRRLLRENVEPEEIAGEVGELMQEFQALRFSFDDESVPAPEDEAERKMLNGATVLADKGKAEAPMNRIFRRTGRAAPDQRDSHSG